MLVRELPDEHRGSVLPAEELNEYWNENIFSIKKISKISNDLRIKCELNEDQIKSILNELIFFVFSSCSIKKEFFFVEILPIPYDTTNFVISVITSIQ